MKKELRAQTFPVWGPMDVTVKDLLLVRVKVGDNHSILVIHRLTEDLINGSLQCANINKSL